MVALIAQKLVLNANIDVIGSGFKGEQMLINGTPDNCSVNPTTAFTLASTATQSYTKGEGIVSNNNAFNRGRAPRANGGGSGISGDSGGGGGFSYGAGGIGGKRWCDVNGAVAGGFGGVSLQPYFTQDKLFLGGAGGAGFVTTNNPSTSTDGGGIIILFVDTLVGNGFSILANGTSPVPVVPVGAPDGGGGGGGGGSILFNVESKEGNLTVTANGGDGQDLNTTIIHGPGGGGGGGVLLFSLPVLPAAVTFGAFGGIGGQHSNGVRNASGDGAAGGTFGLYVPIENVNYRANVDGDDVAPVCDIDDDGDGIPDIQEIYAGDHDNDGIPDWNDANFCLDVFEGISGWNCALDGLPNPTADMDGDGYANFMDADFPYCGSFVLGIDKICSNFDPDGDGIPSHLDLDSDNDGIPDIIEAGGADVNGDGQGDSMVDSDGDGLIDLFDNDNTDGPASATPCSVQPGCLDQFSFSTLPIPDTDGDGIPDFLDSDSDNDGIPDVVEAGGTDVNGDGRIDNFGDTDDDGLTDQIDALICEDSVDIVSVTASYGTYLAGPSTGIGNGANASGAPDGAFAQVYDTGDRLVIDLGQVFPTGTSYVLTWRRKASYGGGPTADMVVEESADNATYLTNSVNPQDATQVFRNTLMIAQTPTRYLRMRTLTGSNDDFDFDAVTVGTTNIFYNVYEVCRSRTPLLVTGPDANSDGIPDFVVDADFDGDGIYDFLDLDSDNDGIPDVVEAGGTDTDGDGRADGNLDADSDGFNDLVDGDPTNVLVLGDDSPGANTLNALQVTGSDLNNDGRPDNIVSDDMDGDGLPNQLDLDSDGDGIADVIESNGTDANGDGRIDGNAVDTDNDGFADSVDGDVGNDGVSENSALALVRTGADTDADGAPNSYPNANGDDDMIINMLDIDSDNDGITDNTESQSTAGYVAPSGTDTDNDGIDNAYDATAIVPVDSDLDGVPDYLDTDSDDDTFPDLIEGHDVNGNGFADATSPANTGVSGGTTDVDGDGLYDGWDNNTASSDATNGGLNPSSHPAFFNAVVDRDWRNQKDTDRDGVPDHLDIDDDNDGIIDITEAGGNDPDGNEDGDEFPNWLDTNDDGNGGDGSITSYVDLNGDGIPDVYDFDGDGVPNHLDKDSDNDGILDITEAGGIDINEDGSVDYPTPGNATTMVDADNDGLDDSIDNVDNGSGGGEVTSGTPLAIPNSDGTGNADYLDIDADGDGIIDNIEAQATTGTPVRATVADTDGDGISDAFDPDNGGLYLFPIDTDGDGTPDYLDLDSDDDGESDLIEGWDTNGDGVANTSPAGADADGDGLDDNFDQFVGPYGILNPSKNNQDALDFPDTDAGTTERDWRDEPCSGGAAALSTTNTTTTMSNFCQNDPWTYYYDPADPTQLLFAVDHTPTGGNTNPFTLQVSLTASINPADESGVYSTIDLPNQDATFVLGRYWNLSLTSGSLNGNVTIRFFYNAQEVDTLEATAIRWNQQNAGGTSNVSGLRWFTVNSGTFDPSTPDLQALGIANSTQLFPTAEAVQDGVTYSEFSTNIITGGGLAYTIGTNSVILPVELLMFEAVPTSEREVDLIWITASEVNSDLFKVQRSSDLASWETISSVIAQGNSSEEQRYFITDKNPLSGHSYYRLEQVDFNGTSELSEVRDVYLSSGSISVSFSLYPNPSSGQVYVSVASDIDCTFEILNSLGQKVMEVKTHGSETIVVSDLTPGVYFLEQSAQGSNQTLRFVILK